MYINHSRKQIERIQIKTEFVKYGTQEDAFQMGCEDIRLVFIIILLMKFSFPCSETSINRYNIQLLKRKMKTQILFLFP